VLLIVTGETNPRDCTGIYFFPVIATEYVFRHNTFSVTTMTSNVTIGFCCSKAKCTMPTRNVTFAHRCGSCDELMHAVCGKTDEDDVPICFTCLDSVGPVKKRKLTSRGKNKEATTEKGRRSRGRQYCSLSQ